MWDTFPDELDYFFNHFWWKQLKTSIAHPDHLGSGYDVTAVAHLNPDNSKRSQQTKCVQWPSSTLNHCCVESGRLHLKTVGYHVQVGCEKSTTVSGRQRTVLVIAVGRFVCACVCVCVCVCMWVSIYYTYHVGVCISVFGIQEWSNKQKNHHEKFSDKDEKMIPSGKLRWNLTYKSNFTLHQSLHINKCVLDLKLAACRQRGNKISMAQTTERGRYVLLE